MIDYRLFNCCQDNREPNWAQFVSLELGGCRQADTDNIEGGVSATNAEFFTVYARDPQGYATAITDIHDARDALAVSAQLALRAKMPLNLSPHLGEH